MEARVEALMAVIQTKGQLAMDQHGLKIGDLVDATTLDYPTVQKAIKGGKGRGLSLEAGLKFCSLLQIDPGEYLPDVCTAEQIPEQRKELRKAKIQHQIESLQRQLAQADEAEEEAG